MRAARDSRRIAVITSLPTRYPISHKGVKGPTVRAFFTSSLQPILNKHFTRQTRIRGTDKLNHIHHSDRKVIAMQYEEQQLINGLFQRLETD